MGLFGTVIFTRYFNDLNEFTSGPGTESLCDILCLSGHLSGVALSDRVLQDAILLPFKDCLVPAKRPPDAALFKLCCLVCSGVAPPKKNRTSSSEGVLDTCIHFGPLEDAVDTAQV